MAVSDNLGMYLPTREDYISVSRDITDNLKLLDAAAGKLDIIIDGDTASQNVTKGQFVTVLNSTIAGITDGLYKAAANVASGTSFVAANLTAVTSGALNALGVKSESVTFTTNSSGNYTMGSSWAKDSRVILDIIQDRSNNSYYTGAAFFVFGTSTDGKPVIHAMEANGTLITGNFKTTIVYLSR